MIIKTLTTFFETSVKIINKLNNILLYKDLNIVERSYIVKYKVNMSKTTIR